MPSEIWKVKTRDESIIENEANIFSHIRTFERELLDGAGILELMRRAAIKKYGANQTGCIMINLQIGEQPWLTKPIESADIDAVLAQKGKK